MEKPPAELAKAFSRMSEPLIESLRMPFGPLKLSRPLRHFGRATGLRPGIPMTPDPDFLVHLLEGGSHQEQLRKACGNQFKNLENYLRGTHETTSTTRSLLSAAMQIDEAALGLLAHGLPSGPLMPAYVGMFQFLETVFLGAYRVPTVGTVRCPCCGGDVLDDGHIWWKARDVALPQDAGSFVDRLLKAMLGANLLLETLGTITASDHFDTALLFRLASPACHPIGNWMDEVKKSLGLQHDWQLTARPGYPHDEQSTTPDGRLRKWRSGQDLLPLERALSMVKATKREAVLKHALFAARTLSLAIDIVQAAAETSSRPTRIHVQEMISNRLKMLHLNFGIGIAAWSKANPASVDGEG